MNLTSDIGTSIKKFGKGGGRKAGPAEAGPASVLAEFMAGRSPVAPGTADLKERRARAAMWRPRAPSPVEDPMEGVQEGSTGRAASGPGATHPGQSRTTPARRRQAERPG